jgi:hypothetical protein
MFVEEDVEPFSDGRHYIYRIRITPISNETAELKKPVYLKRLKTKLARLEKPYAIRGKSAMTHDEKEYRIICSLAEVQIPELAKPV